MRSRYKFYNEFGMYFITSSIIELIPVFTTKDYFQILLDSFEFCQREKEVKFHAYVIMDNHFHAIISGENLSNKINSLKRHTAKILIEQSTRDNKFWLLNLFREYKKKYKLKSKHQVWQEGVHPQIIESEKMLLQKMEYIHNNPVKRGLVRFAEEWVYSSASNYMEKESVFEIDKLEL